MLSTGGSSRLDPEDEEEEGGEVVLEEVEEEEEEEAEEQEERVDLEQETSNISPSPASNDRVYQGLLPQHFNLPQKVAILTPLFPVCLSI